MSLLLVLVKNAGIALKEPQVSDSNIFILLSF